LLVAARFPGDALGRGVGPLAVQRITVLIHPRSEAAGGFLFGCRVRGGRRWCGSRRRGGGAGGWLHAGFGDEATGFPSMMRVAEQRVAASYHLAGGGEITLPAGKGVRHQAEKNSEGGADEQRGYQRLQEVFREQPEDQADEQPEP